MNRCSNKTKYLVKRWKKESKKRSKKERKKEKKKTKRKKEKNVNIGRQIFVGAGQITTKNSIFYARAKKFVLISFQQKFDIYGIAIVLKITKT